MNDELNEENDAVVESQEDAIDETIQDEAEDQTTEDQNVEEDSQSDDSEGDSEEPVAAVEDSSNSTDADEYVPEFENSILNDYVSRCIAPIDGPDPCGESEDPASSVVSQIETLGDSIYGSLKSAFGEAYKSDNYLSFDMSSAGRDADGLVDQVVECLSEKSKSLLLACYLPHLMLIVYGTEGFEAGLTVVRELARQYGDNIHPRDKDKLAGFLRRGVYVGNDDKVTDSYRLFLFLPITYDSRLPYTLLRNSRLKESDPAVEGRFSSDAARQEQGVPSSDKVDFYVQLIGSLERIVERSHEANSALGDLLGDSSVDIVNFQFIESIERMGSIVRNLATDHCPGYPPVDEEAEETAEGAVGVAAQTQIASGEIVDRDQAIQMLGKIAEFFYRTERHSPISYRIRDTIRWCKMDFPELLQLLLDGDSNSLAEMKKRVGFDDPEESGGYSNSEYEE